MQQSQANFLFRFQGGLDNDALNELYERDYPSVMQTFQIYLDELDSNIDDLESSFSKKDLTSFRKSIHRIKPVFSYVGLTELYTTFQFIEDECGRLSDPDQITVSFSTLINNVKNSAGIIEMEKNRLADFIAKT